MVSQVDPTAEQNQQLDELTGELRVIIPGVTVLFGFLLTVPFSARYARLGTFDRAAYFVAFLTTALAIVLLLGESAYHRLRGHPYDKGLMLRTANRQAATALVLLSIALAAVVLLVTDVVYGRTLALISTLLILLGEGTIWFALPIARRLQNR